MVQNTEWQAGGTTDHLPIIKSANRLCEALVEFGGGDDGDTLERLLAYHREHAHLGKEYAVVIQEFDSSFQYGNIRRWQQHAPNDLLLLNTSRT